jgi:hypothetical protein
MNLDRLSETEMQGESESRDRRSAVLVDCSRPLNESERVNDVGEMLQDHAKPIATTADRPRREREQSVVGLWIARRSRPQLALAIVTLVVIAVVVVVAVAAGSSSSGSGCSDVSALDATANRLQADALAGNITAALGDAQELSNAINTVEGEIENSSQSMQAKLATALGDLQDADNAASNITGDNSQSGGSVAQVAYDVQNADGAGLHSVSC